LPGFIGASVWIAFGIEKPAHGSNRPTPLTGRAGIGNVGTQVCNEKTNARPISRCSQWRKLSVNSDK
jgi:hypothetical protein